MSAIQFIQVTPEELEDKILSGVKKIFNSLNQPKDQEELLTPDETAKLCKASRQTVHNWTRNGKLNAYAISTRVYYKKSEVMAALKPIEVKPTNARG